MKVIASIYQCECGRNIIVLDDNMEFDGNLNPEQMECPVCGGEMVSECTRTIDIN